MQLGSPTAARVLGISSLITMLKYCVTVGRTNVSTGKEHTCYMLHALQKYNEQQVLCGMWGSVFFHVAFLWGPYLPWSKLIESADHLLRFSKKKKVFEKVSLTALCFISI